MCLILFINSLAKLVILSLKLILDNLKVEFCYIASAKYFAAVTSYSSIVVLDNENSYFLTSEIYLRL